jgi:hypothetical protein
VLLLNGETVIDPSYEIHSMENRRYFDNFKDFTNSFCDKYNKINVTKCLQDNIAFTKIAKRINDGDFTVVDKEFYHLQADFIEREFRSELNPV